MIGSIKYLGDGKYLLTVSLGYDENHKQRRKSKVVYAKTKKEAERMLIEFHNELDSRCYGRASTMMKFEDFIPLFVKRHGRNITEVGMANYKHMLNLRIGPAFNHRVMNEITTEDILTFMDYLSTPAARLGGVKDKPLSSESILKHYRLLHLIFRKAVQWSVLSHSPCEKISADMLPKLHTNHNPILDEDSLQRLCDILEHKKQTPEFIAKKLFFYISLTCGTRRGETGALTWDCIDLKNHQLVIERGLKVLNGNVIGIGEPKTPGSKRTLFFDDYLSGLFLLHKKNQDQWLKENGVSNPLNLVFIGNKIGPDKQATFYRVAGVYLWLKRIVKANHLGRLTLHGLRSQAATLAVGILPVPMLAQMLGHTDLSTTSRYIKDLTPVRKEMTNGLLDKINGIRKLTYKKGVD